MRHKVYHSGYAVNELSNVAMREHRLGVGVPEALRWRGRPGRAEVEFGLFCFGLVCGVRGDTVVASMATFAVLGTFDTKREDHRTVADRTQEHRHSMQFFQGPKLASEKLPLAMFGVSDEGTLARTRCEARVET